MSKSLFIGRWQPFHDGHRAIIDKVLAEGRPVVIGVRDTDVSEHNPYTVDERIAKIREVYGDHPHVEILVIPDVTEVCYGRTPGWTVRRVRPDNHELEAVSATKIRGGRKGTVWLTGNVRAGKTSIAQLLKDRLNAVVLDGDEMRKTISREFGFSREDRHAHNLRVARLAALLNAQGHNVVVSVIAPFEETRREIEAIVDPYWVYIRGGEVASKDMPYEEPTNYGLMIDPTADSLLESIETIVKSVGGIR